ncbi:MAG: TonB-dependent receptor [Sphingobacteriales bacterium]|nr:MAG: TonB-dependent receptor [Sphingobacteriales bacterium]
MQNAAYGYIYGVQTSLQVKFGHGLGLAAHYNYQRGKEEDESGEVSSLRHATPAFGLVRLTWNQKKLTTEINVQFNSEISNSRLALSEQDKPQIYAPDSNGLPYAPAWHTLNVKALYRLADYLQLNAGVENITDQRYRTYSSGITAPGRNLVVSVRGVF